MTQDSPYSPLPVLYLVDPSTAVTGAFIAARQIAQSLTGRMRVVLVLPLGHRMEPEALRDFWRVEILPMANPSKRIAALPRYAWLLIRSSLQLYRRMAKDGASRLILNDFYLLHGVVLRMMGYRGTIVQWVRCEPRRFAGFVAAPVLWMVRRSANRIVATSKYIAAQLPQNAVPVVLYDYYAGSTRPPQQWQAGDAKIFVYIGNYIPGKGQDIALEAFAKAAESDPLLQLHFYGGDMGLEKNRHYRQMLESRARALGVESRVRIESYVTDRYAVLAHAFAALNFSESESFSMTVLEAAGAGVPVIATRSGGPQEIIEDGVSGYLIPVGDEAAATARILALARQPEVAARIGEAAAARVRKYFSAEPFRNQLSELLGT